MNGEQLSVVMKFQFCFIGSCQGIPTQADSLDCWEGFLEHFKIQPRHSIVIEEEHFLNVKVPGYFRNFSYKVEAEIQIDNNDTIQSDCVVVVVLEL